jgi:serine/threonine-protein kinase RIO1
MWRDEYYNEDLYMNIKFQGERKMFNRWQRKECRQMVMASDFEAVSAVNEQTDSSLI